VRARLLAFRPPDNVLERGMARISSFLALAAAILPLSLSTPLEAKPLTAFQAQQIAAKHVQAESQQKLIAIKGIRSATELTPETWSFLYYDEMAGQQGRQVTVSNKAVTGIRDGYLDLGSMRLAAYKLEEVVEPSQLKIDSDKALDILTQTNLLKPYSLSSVTYTLAKDKGLREPVWRLQVYVDKDGKEDDIGFARISAADGKIIEMKFKPFEPAPANK
jgi:hypothetical protein